MQINISGHGISITDALRQYTTAKLERLSPLVEKDTLISVILEVEKLAQIAKATLHLWGHDLHTSAESTDLYNAIDALEDKLYNLMIKHKKKMTKKHNKSNTKILE